MQSLGAETIQEKETAQPRNPSSNDVLVSFIQEIPSYLKEAMSTFIEEHPNWDQYRLIQAAISGFLLDKGNTSIEMRRFYSQSMFCKKSLRDSM